MPLLGTLKNVPIMLLRCPLKSLLRPPRRLYATSVLQKLNPHPHIPEPFAYPQSQPEINDDIYVAMSSGVDSSVTAALLSKMHKNVCGVYMANWSQLAKCTEGEWSDVQRVCDHLQIPCERVNFEKEYWADVFTPMLEMYENGFTPNPDLGCNTYIKFGKMIEHLAARYDVNSKNWWLATGHYARVEKASANKYNLLRAYDGNKDQSYYLANIPGKVLPRILLPLGHYTKPQVRKMAAEFGLHTALKADSQGLCFVSPDHTKFRHFLDEFLPPKPGNIITEDGKVWGKHQGIWHATIGQRLGVSMPQGNPKYSGVWFVGEKRIATNEIVIVKGGQNEKLFLKLLEVSNWAWINCDPQEDLEELTLQFRSLQDPVEVSLISVGEKSVTIELKDPQRAMAPGQNAVLYKGNKVLGAGVLMKTFH